MFLIYFFSVLLLLFCSTFLAHKLGVFIISNLKLAYEKNNYLIIYLFQAFNLCQIMKFRFLKMACNVFEVLEDVFLKLLWQNTSISQIRVYCFSLIIDYKQRYITYWKVGSRQSRLLGNLSLVLIQGKSKNIHVKCVLVSSITVIVLNVLNTI